MPLEKPVHTKDSFRGKKYDIGEHTYGLPIVRDWGGDSNLFVGKFCSIADNVTIFLGGNHRIDWITTYPFSEFLECFPSAENINGHPASKGNVIIGNDVWIGSGVTILSGITIGNGAVIGAQSVVSKNVLPYEVVVGNPARVIKKRFDEEIIIKLQEIAWWNWPIEKINSQVKHLCNNDIQNFVSQNWKTTDF